MHDLLLALGLEALYQTVLPGLLAAGAGFGRREFAARPVLCAVMPWAMVAAYERGSDALALVMRQERAQARVLHANGH